MTHAVFLFFFTCPRGGGSGQWSRGENARKGACMPRLSCCELCALFWTLVQRRDSVNFWSIDHGFKRENGGGMKERSFEKTLALFVLASSLSVSLA